LLGNVRLTMVRVETVWHKLGCHALPPYKFSP
jgi:hypothetical protein